jgi:hypothetical protein
MVFIEFAIFDSQYDRAAWRGPGHGRRQVTSEGNGRFGPNRAKDEGVM